MRRIDIEAAVIGIVAIICIVVCVQVMMVSAWSRETDRLKKRVRTLEKAARRLRQHQPQISGKLHLTMDGKTRVLDAKMVPTVTQGQQDKRLSRRAPSTSLSRLP